MTHDGKDDPPNTPAQAVLLQDFSVCLFLCVHVIKEVITNTGGWREN